jgi:hypothetical protein
MMLEDFDKVNLNILKNNARSSQDNIIIISSKGIRSSKEAFLSKKKKRELLFI